MKIDNRIITENKRQMKFSRLKWSGNLFLYNSFICAVGITAVMIIIIANAVFIIIFLTPPQHLEAVGEVNRAGLEPAYTFTFHNAQLEIHIGTFNQLQPLSPVNV